jgi:hypothetical protein
MLVQRVGTGWNWQDCQTVPEIFWNLILQYKT